MSKEKNYNLNDLKSDTIDEFKELYKDYTCINRAITEIADSNVPIYYYDIAQYLAHNFILGQTETDLGATEPFAIIQQNIFTELQEALHIWCSDNLNMEERN